MSFLHHSPILPQQLSWQPYLFLKPTHVHTFYIHLHPFSQSPPESNHHGMSPPKRIYPISAPRLNLLLPTKSSCCFHHKQSGDASTRYAPPLIYIFVSTFRIQKWCALHFSYLIVHADRIKHYHCHQPTANRDMEPWLWVQGSFKKFPIFHSCFECNFFN
jgi:hypothetical protein